MRCPSSSSPAGPGVNEPARARSGLTTVALDQERRVESDPTVLVQIGANVGADIRQQRRAERGIGREPGARDLELQLALRAEARGKIARGLAS